MQKTCKIDDQISAFADGELDLSLHGPVMKSFQDPSVLNVWKNYHTIGELLRSGDAGCDPSINFSRQLAARLKDEPVHVKSETCFVEHPASVDMPDLKGHGWMRRIAVPGMAIAATAMFAVPIGLDLLDPSDNSNQLSLVAPAIQNSQIDDYLSAHQRFSPSAYTTAHYARFSSSEND